MLAGAAAFFRVATMSAVLWCCQLADTELAIPAAIQPEMDEIRQTAIVIEQTCQLPGSLSTGLASLPALSIV